jgi:hypothetical protein
MVKVKLSTLAKQAKHGFERCKRGRTDYVNGTLELAIALSKARKELPADQKFHAWLSKAGLASISRDDRAALVCIGENIKRARAYFHENPDSWSWRSCATELRRLTLVVPVSQTAKPTHGERVVTNVAFEELRTVVPIYSTEPEESAPPVLTLVASNDEPQQPPLPTITELPEAPRLVAAVEAVHGVVEASSFPASALAFYCGDVSAGDVRAAALWMTTLADALAALEDQQRMTN